MRHQVDIIDYRRRAAVHSPKESGADALSRPRSRRRSRGRNTNNLVGAALLALSAAFVAASFAAAEVSGAREEGGFGLPDQGTILEGARNHESTLVEDAPETTGAVAAEQTIQPSGMTTTSAHEDTGGASGIVPYQATDQYRDPARLAETGGLGFLGAGAALLAGAAILAYGILASRPKDPPRPDARRGGDDDVAPRA